MFLHHRLYACRFVMRTVRATVPAWLCTMALRLIGFAYITRCLPSVENICQRKGCTCCNQFYSETLNIKMRDYEARLKKSHPCDIENLPHTQHASVTINHALWYIPQDSVLGAFVSVGHFFSDTTNLRLY